MAKKFAEHNGLNLTKTNNDVLAGVGEERYLPQVYRRA